MLRETETRTFETQTIKKTSRDRDWPEGNCRTEIAVKDIFTGLMSLLLPNHSASSKAAADAFAKAQKAL